MGVGAGLYMYDVVVKTLTFAISSTDEFLLLRPKERLRSRPIVMSLSVCLSLFCPRAYAHRRDLYHFLRMLPMCVARSSSGTLTIGRIAYRRERGDGSAQRGRSVYSYDCHVIAGSC